MAEKNCKAEVGDFALCRWWDAKGEVWWTPCEVAAVDDNGIATEFMRGRRRLQKDFGTRYIDSKSICKPHILLPKLKSRYRLLHEARRAVIAAMAECGLAIPEVADE